MALYVGGQRLARLYRGATPIARAYRGTTRVFDSAPAHYLANAVHFDGTNDYLNRAGDLTGNTDGKEGIFSAWIKFQGGDGTTQVIWTSRDSGNFGLIVQRMNTNVFRCVGRTSAGVQALEIFSSSMYTSSSGWLHLLLSWNLAETTAWLYVNDANDLAADGTVANGTLDYTKGEHALGSNHMGANKFYGDVADIYVNYETHLDFSIEIHRRKFISAIGKPVFLGASAELPTGLAPIVFLSGATTGWHQNKGSGGGFTLNGALSAATTKPGD